MMEHMRDTQVEAGVMGEAGQRVEPRPMQLRRLRLSRPRPQAPSHAQLEEVRGKSLQDKPFQTKLE